MARQPLTPKRRKIQLEYMEPDFSSLDTAIDGISSSGSQEEAVAALAKATVGINSYFGQPRPMLDPHLTMALLGRLCRYTPFNQLVNDRSSNPQLTS